MHSNSINKLLIVNLIHRYLLNIFIKLIVTMGFIFILNLCNSEGETFKSPYLS
jgi:hypothetical protein